MRLSGVVFYEYDIIEYDDSYVPSKYDYGEGGGGK